MITFKELFEAKDAGGHGSEKHHVMSFARMNPPTTGHMEVVSKLHAVAKEHNAPHSLIVSGSNDAKKNPLTAEQKVKHLKRYSPETNVKAADKESPTILHHAAALHKSGVEHLHVVAGSDRHKEMHDLLHKYNTGEEHKHGSFKFKSITMHSSGERDPDSEGTTGMSGTKMRQHAHDKNFAEFRKGVPPHVSDKHAHELMNNVRRGSGIKEEAISYQTFMEVRMSAAVKLQRAFEREQQKSAASRERAKQLLAPKKPEPVKEETIDETIVRVDSGYEVKSETGKNLGGSPTLAGAKKRLKQVEYFKHMKEEEMQFTESVHDNRTGFAKKKREDDEGGELYRHTYKFHVSKPGVEDGKKHERHVTTPLTTRKKHELEHLARAHITKQGYKIHEDVKETPTGRIHTKNDYEGYPSTFKDKEQNKLKNSQDRHRMNKAIPSNDKLKEEAGDKRGAYEKKSPVVIAPKDPKAKTYGKIVSKIRTMAEESDVYAKSEENKRSADAAKKQGNMFDHHMHMADHHENLSQWHSEKGRHGVADSHAEKAEEHHDKAMSLKEARGLWDNIHAKQKRIKNGSGERMRKPGSKGAPTADALKASQESFDQTFDMLEEAAKSIDKGEYDYEGQMARTQLQTTLRNCTDLIDMIEDDENMPEWVQSKITLAQDYITTVRDYLQSKEELEEATAYYNKPSFLKSMGRIAKQERLAREKKEAEAKQKPVKEETVEEAATGAKPGWMLRQDPELAKKLKDQQARKKFVAGEPTKKNVKEETQETEMGLKSFKTLVKEGTLQSSGDDSIPTLTKAPQAPILDRKYIKGTPEHKAYKATKKPINGMPTGKYNEELEEGLMDAVKKVAKKAAEVLGGPDDEGHKKDLQKKMGVPQTGKVGMAKQNEEVDEELKGDQHKLDKNKNGKLDAEDFKKLRKEDVEQIEENHLMDYRRYTQAAKNASSKGDHDIAKDAAAKAQKSAEHYTRLTGKKPTFNEGVESLEEANHREFASQGKMHPDMAKHMKTGQETDFYHSKTGDKISGVVKHTTGGEVHIKAHKDGKMGAGDVHKFKVSSTLDEATKHVAPTNKKPAIDIDKVHTAGDEPHHETFETIKKAVRKEGYTVSDLFQALKEGMWPGTPEYKAKYDGAKQGGGSGVKKGSRYGGSLQKDEPEHDEEPATAGRKVGSKSGARKNLGNSKLHK
jgi:hypothetical protein